MKKYKYSCVSRLFDNDSCNFVRLIKHNCARLCNFQLNFHSILSEAPHHPLRSTIILA